MRWPIIQQVFGDMLRKTPVFLIGDEAGEKRWGELHKRVIEHVVNLLDE
jgi:26S proteasome regulatory subunit N5